MNWQFENKSTLQTLCIMWFFKICAIFWRKIFTRLEKFSHHTHRQIDSHMPRIFQSLTFRIWWRNSQPQKEAHTNQKLWWKWLFCILLLLCTLFYIHYLFFWKNATSYYGFSLNILVKDLWFWKILWCKRPLRSWSHCFHR